MKSGAMLVAGEGGPAATATALHSRHIPQTAKSIRFMFLAGSSRTAATRVSPAPGSARVDEVDARGDRPAGPVGAVPHPLAGGPSLALGDPASARVEDVEAHGTHRT